MPEYLIDIRTNLHPEEIEAYVQRVQHGIAQLASRAQTVAREGTVIPNSGGQIQVPGRAPADLEGQARGLHISALASLRASAGNFRPEEIQTHLSQLNRDFEQLHIQLAGIHSGLITNKEDLERNVSRAATVASKRAATAADPGDIGGAAAERESARLLKQRVAEEAIRLEATQRGIVFSNESTAAEREAAVKVARRAQVEEVRTLSAQRALAAESTITETVAQRKVYERELNAAINARARQIERERAGDTGPGSLFQRAQAYFANRNKLPSQQRDANEFSTGGQFISQRLFQGGAYAVAGAALYSMVGNIRSLIDEGEKTQVMFGQLKAQLTEVGQADAFPAVRDHILDMAHASGIAADQVGALAGTMLGAFNDPQEAIAATNAGLALMQVSGLALADIQNNLVAVMRTFGITGAEAMNKVDDQVNHLRDTFGTSQREIIDGVGNIAPLAQEMGLSFREASTIIAGASAVSGRSATQTANEIGRALTQIEKQLPIITNILNQPQSAGLLDAVEGHVAEGKTGQVLIDLIRHWQELSKAQQNTILTAIGGRREFASLAAALGENRKIIAALDDQSDHSGVTAQRLAEYHRSLSYQLKQAGEAFRQLGVAILNSPIGQALALIVQGGGDVARWLGNFLGLLGRLNDLLGGAPSRVVAFAGAWLILRNILSIEHLQKAVGLLAQIGRNVGGKLTGTGAADSAASGGAAVAEGGTAAATEMRTGVVEGGAEAANLMRAGIIEAAGFFSDEFGAVSATQIAAINESLAATFATGAEELAAAESAAVAELTAELSALTAGMGEAAAAQSAAATLQVEAAAAQNVAAQTQVAAGIEGAVAGVGGKLAGAAEAGGALGKLATGAGSALGPLAKFAGLLEAAAPVIAVVAGYEIGKAVKHPVEDLTSPRGPNDIVLRRDLFRQSLTGETRKQLDQYWKGEFERMQREGRGADVQATANRQLPSRGGAPGTSGIGSLFADRSKIEAEREKIKEARKLLGEQLGQGGNQEYTQSVITSLEQAGFLKGDTAGDLAEKISKNDYETYKKVSQLYNKHKGNAKFQERLAQAKQESDVISGNAAKTAQDLQKQFEAGQITFDVLQAGLNRQLGVYKEMANRAGGEKNLPQAVQQQMDALQEQVDKNQRDRSDQLLRAQDAREAADAGRKGRPEQIQAALAKAARDAQAAQQHDDPEKAAQAYAEQQKAQQDQLDYDSAARKAQIDIRRARATSNYDPVGAAQADLDAANEDLSQAKDDAARDEARANIVQKEFSLQEAKDQLAKTRRQGQAALIRAYAEERYDPVAAAQADLDLALADQAANHDRAQDDALAAAVVQRRFAVEQAKEQEAATRRQGHAQLLQAQAASRYDPVASAQADLALAEADLRAPHDPAQDEALQARVQQAANAVNQSIIDEAHALNALRQEQDRGNAQQVAADAVAAAEADVARIVAAGGYGKAAWAEAQRALISAQRQAVDAALASTNAVLDYDEALARAAGDNVRAAQDEYQKALAAYNAALQKGDTDAARNIQADLVTKAAGVRDAQIRTGESNIQFQLEMGQISTQQAIAMYEGLLQLAQGNQEWTQELLLKINQLRKDAAKDLAFDIPSDIRLPTLYEVRRLDQSAAAGYGYNDNRQIQVQYNVYTPMDHQQTMNDLADALSGSPRTGAAPRTYP